MYRSKRLSKRVVDGLWELFVLVKYPKIILLVATTVAAGFLFQDESVQSFFHGLGDLGYVSAFLGGALFAFGFGAPFGVALLATIANDVNILLAGCVGGLGALLSDYLLFKFIRMTFQDEIDKFRDSKAFGIFNGLVMKKMPPRLAYYISMGVAGIIIASPLPDEIGVTLLASLTAVKERVFMVVAFSLNTLGILAVLGAGLLL